MQQECANKHSPRLGTLIKRDGRVYKRGQQRWGGILEQKYSFCRNRTAGKSKDPLKGHTVVFFTSVGRKKLIILEGQKFSFQKHNANNDASNDEAGPFTSLQFSCKVCSTQIFVSNTFCICSSSPKLRLWQGYSSHSIWQCHHPVPSVWIECRGESESPVYLKLSFVFHFLMIRKLTISVLLSGTRYLSNVNSANTNEEK